MIWQNILLKDQHWSIMIAETFTSSYAWPKWESFSYLGRRCLARQHPSFSREAYTDWLEFGGLLSNRATSSICTKNIFQVPKNNTCKQTLSGKKFSGSIENPNSTGKMAFRGGDNDLSERSYHNL